MCKEYIKKITTLDKCPTKRTKNNRNCNYQTTVVVPTEEMSAEKFHYEELTPDQMATLH
jgi:hypothetical protein